MLDELTTSGEVVWAGQGSVPGNDGWIVLATAEAAPLLLPAPVELPDSPLHEGVLVALRGDAALFFRTLSDRVASTDDADLGATLWDLVWAGWLTNDTFAPVRALVSGSSRNRSPARATRSRYGRPARPGLPSRTGPPSVAGRWSRTPPRDEDATRRAYALAETLLDRHGVLTRGAVQAEGVEGGFSGIYRVLSAFEEAGRARRGYVVEGLGAAQFSLPGAVDRIRASVGRDRPGDTPRTVVLAATDPANPYGAALGWPDRPTVEGATGSGHRPGRKAGALVVLVDGALTLYVERGGRSLLSWSDDEPTIQAGADALALAVREGALSGLRVERVDGDQIAHTPLANALESAGFRATPRGLRLRG
jgi:ATP-dependent Lhr-like helicase